MNVKKFVDKYIGKKVDFDNQFGAQCVDLFRQFCQDVWNVPHLGGVNGAKDIYLNYENMSAEIKFTDRVEYTGASRPQEGDVVIFRESSSNQYGHIAICLYSTERIIIVFEQDGFVQNGAKIGTWSYDRLLGWLVKK